MCVFVCALCCVFPEYIFCEKVLPIHTVRACRFFLRFSLPAAPTPGLVLLASALHFYIFYNHQGTQKYS